MKLLSDLTPASSEALLAISQLTGGDYLQRIADWLQGELDVFAVSVGEMVADGRDEIRISAFAARNSIPAPDSYPLVGTPCMQVTLGSPCSIPDSAVDAYPDDEILRQYDIQSYFGLPLHDAFGHTFGVFCLFDDAGDATGRERIVPLMEWLAPRIADEASSLRNRRNMLNAVQWLSPADPATFFVNIAAHLAEVMQVTTAVIAESSEGDAGHCIVRALRHAGLGLAEYEDNPLDDVGALGRLARHDDEVLYIADGLQTRYPDDKLISELELEGFLARPLRDSEGETRGHILLAHTRPLDVSLVSSPVFQIYAARVMGEIERLREENQRAEMIREIMAKHKLESIGLMAGHVAHDFNNLLMAILGNANLAAEAVPLENPLRRYITNIESAAVSAGEVVSQLLDYAGRKPARHEPLDVNEALRGASRLVELTRYPSAEVRYELSDSLPFVRADATQLQHIVINMVLNAAEALKDGAGTITIRADLVELDAAQIERLIQGRELLPGAYVCISVTDDGVGMNAETLMRVFDPFFSSKPDGRGLGLSDVRGFIESCAGGLHVTSGPDIGTTVCLYIEPCEPTGVADKPLENRDYPILDGPLLVIDDEDTAAAVVAQLLRQMGYEVHVCSNGADALTWVSSGVVPAIALIDVRMPVLDGWGTLAKLRDQQPDLPVVMMSGYLKKSVPLLARHRVAMLHKPFGPEQLAGALSDALARLGERQHAADAEDQAAL